MTGLDALRASAGENEGSGTGVLLGTLLAALGALLVLIFVFRSFMAIVPLLMALVAIPTTFLLVWPIASVTDVSVIVQFLVALIGLGIAIDYALLVVVRWREERQQPNVTNEAAVRNAMQHAGSAVVFSGTTVAISLLALARPADAVPAQHRHRRAADRAGQRRRRDHAAAGRPGDDRAEARLAPQPTATPRASRGWSAWARLVVRHRWVAAAASTAVLVALVVAASHDPAREPARRLARTGRARTRRPRAAGGLGHRHRPALALRRARPLGRPRAPSRRRSPRSRVSAARQRPPTGAATGRRSSSIIPTEDGNSAGRPRDARPPPRRRRCRPR